MLPPIDLPPVDPVLDLATLANMMGVHLSTVRRLIRREEIISVRLSPRRVGVRLSEANRYMRDGYKGPWR
jgi:hypothetical protein